MENQILQLLLWMIGLIATQYHNGSNITFEAQVLYDILIDQARKNSLTWMVMESLI
jgi:hypothetical protein